MKKIIVLLIVLALSGCCTLAVCDARGSGFFDRYGKEQSSDTPDTPSDAGTGQSISIMIDGRTVELAFDSSPDYSSSSNGMVQASYYAYAADGVTLYELYLIFPDSAESGMIITPDYSALINAESSVVLIVSDEKSEQYYFASILDGAIFPEGSDFTICIDDVIRENGTVTYTGRLSASLIALDMVSGQVSDTLTITETPFSFTLGGADGDNERHSDPLPTSQPGESDMRKV